ASLVVSNSVSADADDEFNEWSSGIHVPDFLQFASLLSPRRFTRAEHQFLPSDDALGRRYLAIYEVETDDPAALFEDVHAARVDGRIRPTETIQRDPPPITMLFELTEGPVS
ncbi:MAG: hypothetical protein OXH97_11690, partial [Chloroflexota bacterium]|nr:hypothetical protein [Chloroflexota bacterium]